jgi:hypothetical protein
MITQNFKNIISVLCIAFALFVLCLITTSNVNAATFFTSKVPNTRKLIVNSSGNVAAGSVHDTLKGMKFDGYINNYGFMLDEQLSNEVFAEYEATNTVKSATILAKIKAAIKAGNSETDRHMKQNFKEGSDITVWAGLPAAMCESSTRKLVFVTLRAFYRTDGTKAGEEATLLGTNCTEWKKWLNQNGTKTVLYSLKMYMPKTSSGSTTSSPPDKPINVLVMSMDPNVTDEELKNKYAPMVKDAIYSIGVVSNSSVYKNAFGVYDCPKAYCKYQELGDINNMNLQVPVGADLIVGITESGPSTSVLNNACDNIGKRLVVRTRPERTTILHEFGHAFACLRHEGDWIGEDANEGGCVQGSKPNTCLWGSSGISYDISKCLGNNSLMDGAGSKFCDAEESLIEIMINKYLGAGSGSNSSQSSGSNSSQSSGSQTTGSQTSNNSNSSQSSNQSSSGSNTSQSSNTSSGNTDTANRFPIMVVNKGYNGLKSQDFVYAWFTDGSLRYSAGSEPPQSVVDSKLPAVLDAIKQAKGSKMLMVSDVDTLKKILPKHKALLDQAGIKFIGYDMELSPPGTEREEIDARDSSDMSKNPIAIAAKLSKENGYKLVWGAIFANTYNIPDNVMKGLIENGLWGVAFQMQNQWDNPNDPEKSLRNAITRYKRDAKDWVGTTLHVTVQLMTNGNDCLSQGGTVQMSKCSSLIQGLINDKMIDSFSVWAQGGVVSENFLKNVLGKYYTSTPSGIVTADQGSTGDGNTDNPDDSTGDSETGNNKLSILPAFCNDMKSENKAHPMRYLPDVHPKNKLTVLFIGKGYAASEIKTMCEDAVIAANVIGEDSQYGFFADKYEPYFSNAGLSSDMYWDKQGEIIGEFQQVRYATKADIVIIFAKDNEIYSPGYVVKEYIGNAKDNGYSLNTVMGVDAIPDIWTIRPANSDDYKITLRHELGHFFGFGHVDALVYNSSMWSSIKASIEKMVSGQMGYNWEK